MPVREKDAEEEAIPYARKMALSIVDRQHETSPSPDNDISGRRRTTAAARPVPRTLTQLFASVNVVHNAPTTTITTSTRHAATSVREDVQPLDVISRRGHRCRFIIARVDATDATFFGHMPNGLDDVSSCKCAAAAAQHTRVLITKIPS